MPGPVLVANARATFALSPLALTMLVPADAVRGDVLVALVVHGSSDAAATTPAGWRLAGSVGSGIKLDVYTRMVATGDPASVVFAIATRANEWQGQILVIRGSAPAIALEGSAFAAFSAATSLSTPGVNCQQITNLVVGVWSCSGAPGLTLPAGFTSIDRFSTSLSTNRTLMLGYQLAGATGALTFAAASSSASTSGSAFAIVLRDRMPPTPAALVDLVPGNIGLIGRDTRPAR